MSLFVDVCCVSLSLLVFSLCVIAVRRCRLWNCLLFLSLSPMTSFYWFFFFFFVSLFCSLSPVVPFCLVFALALIHPYKHNMDMDKTLLSEDGNPFFQICLKMGFRFSENLKNLFLSSKLIVILSRSSKNTCYTEKKKETGPK